MKTATVDYVMSLDPCPQYTRERVEELFDGREELSVLDILDLPIDADDICWAVLRRHFFSDSDLRMMAAAFAERVLHIFEREHPSDMRPRNAIKAARLFAMGEATPSSLDVAWAESWDAAWDAARAAAWDASCDAARSASMAALCDVIMAVSGDVACAEQLEIIKIYAKNTE